MALMWDHIQPPDMSSVLIEWAMRGQYGLAPTRWTQQLQAIRDLPEVKKP